MKYIQEDTNNLIIWQKWFDPFGEDDIGSQYSIDNSDIDNDKEPGDDYNTDKSDHEDKSTMNVSRPMKAIATPMGLIPYTENTASGKIFNFWVGHANFNISPKIAQIIEDTDGVEILDVFTRYRFRIAIGKAFSDSRVMKEINDRIYKFLDG